MSQAAVVNFLNEQKRSNDKELAEEWGLMEELYNEKWVEFFSLIYFIFNGIFTQICPFMHLI